MKTNRSLVKPHPATNGDLSALFADTALKNPATEPSLATIVQFAWDKAQDGLRHIVEFGALLLEVDKWLKARPGAKRGQGSYGLRNWLAEHCPEVNYDTARGYREAAKGLLAAAQLAADRPLLALMGENPLTDEEEESAREKVMDVIASSSLRLLKAAAKADVEKAGPKKGNQSDGKRAVPEGEREKKALEDALAEANGISRVCADRIRLRRAAAANLEAFEAMRSRVADALHSIDEVIAEARG